MSEINLTGKTWTELVFEGRNKSYGAYELRRENGRTTLKAFFVGILFIGALFAGGFLMSSFGETAAIPATPAPPELHPAEKRIIANRGINFFMLIDL